MAVITGIGCRRREELVVLAGQYVDRVGLVGFADDLQRFADERPESRVRIEL
ncbi:hypothetical protein [Mycobacterium leprae]|nr:hypothetical protein [Mycobacterium leprae]